MDAAWGPGRREAPGAGGDAHPAPRAATSTLRCWRQRPLLLETAATSAANGKSPGLETTIPDAGDVATECWNWPMSMMQPRRRLAGRRWLADVGTGDAGHVGCWNRWLWMLEPAGAGATTRRPFAGTGQGWSCIQCWNGSDVARDARTSFGGSCNPSWLELQPRKHAGFRGKVPQNLREGWRGRGGACAVPTDGNAERRCFDKECAWGSSHGGLRSRLGFFVVGMPNFRSVSSPWRRGWGFRKVRLRRCAPRRGVRETCASGTGGRREKQGAIEVDHLAQLSFVQSKGCAATG